jgi:hypothetical protein
LPRQAWDNNDKGLSDSEWEREETSGWCRFPHQLHEPACASAIRVVQGRRLPPPEDTTRLQQIRRRCCTATLAITIVVVISVITRLLVFILIISFAVGFVSISSGRSGCSGGCGLVVV